MAVYSGMSFLSLEECDFDWVCVRLLCRSAETVETLRYAEFLDCGTLTGIVLSEYLATYPESRVVLRVLRCPVVRDFWLLVYPYYNRLLSARDGGEERIFLDEFEAAVPDSAVSKAMWRLDLFPWDYKEEDLTDSRFNGSLLLMAVSTKRTSLMRQLLERGVRIDSTRSGFSPLHLAVALNYEEGLDIMFEYMDFEFDVDQVPATLSKLDAEELLRKERCLLNLWYHRDGDGLMHIACAMSTNQILRKVLRKCRSMFTRDRILEMQMTPYQVCFRESRIDSARILRECGFLDVRSVLNRNALTMACEKGRLDFVRLLMDAQPPVGDYRNPQSTPLHVCARKGQLGALEVLLGSKRWQSKLVLNELDRHGHTALFYACAKGHIAIMRQLLFHGAEPNWSPIFGSAVHAAVSFCQLEALHVLLDSGGDLDIDVAGIDVNVNCFDLAVTSTEPNTNTVLCVSEEMKGISYRPRTREQYTRIYRSCKDVHRRFREALRNDRR